MTKPKILVIDIETSPALAYVWRLFKENISLDQLLVPSAPICFAAKFVGEKEIHFYSEWEHGRQAMIEAAHKLLSEADAVVGYNQDKFDLPKLRGEFLLAGLPPPPPLTSIDLYKSVRKFGFQSNRLAYIGPFLDVGRKIKHEGFQLWADVEAGVPKAQDKMRRYCIGDVKLTERLYKKIRAYIPNHPHLGDTGSAQCGACQSHKVQSRGYRRTKAFRIQRLHCQECGSWQDGKRHKV